MPIMLDCLCGRKLRVRDDYAGKQGHCPACGRVVDIPDPNQPAEWPAAAHLNSEPPLSPTFFVTAEPADQAETKPTPLWPLTPAERSVARPRRWIGRVVLGVLAGAFVGVIIFFGRGLLPGGLGQRLAVTATEEVYYKDVKEDDARLLGRTLKELGYFNGGTRKTVQLSRKDNRYVIAFVIQEGAWTDPDAVEELRLLGLQVAARIYDGQPVEVRLCDQHMSVKKSLLVNESLGRCLVVSPREEIYYRDVKEDEARQLGELLKQLQHFNGQGPCAVLVAREAGEVKLTLVVLEGIWNDEEAVRHCQALGWQIRRQVFGNEALEMRLADQRLRIKKALPIR
jgi:hypothetical protein